MQIARLAGGQDERDVVVRAAVDLAVRRMGRREQRFLRGALGIATGDPNAVAQCGMCGRTFPHGFLVAAHIKPRHMCSDAERLDLPFLGGCPLPEDAPTTPAILSDQVGYVEFIDTAALSALAEDRDIHLDIRVLPGAFLYHGSPLAVVQGGPLPEDLADKVRRAFTIAKARSFDQDPRFGIITLSEVALRALSPAVNDPGTAIDVIGRQVRLLTLWSEGWHKADGHKAKYPRLRVPPLRHDDICDDAFHLIARDGAGQIDVLTRLVKALDALRRIGPAPARQAADRQLRLAADRGLAGLPNDADRDRLRQVLDGLDRGWTA